MYVLEHIFKMVTSVQTTQKCRLIPTWDGERNLEHLHHTHNTVTHGLLFIEQISSEAVAKQEIAETDAPETPRQTHPQTRTVN